LPGVERLRAFFVERTDHETLKPTNHRQPPPDWETSRAFFVSFSGRAEKSGRTCWPDFWPVTAIRFFVPVYQAGNSGKILAPPLRLGAREIRFMKSKLQSAVRRWLRWHSHRNWLALQKCAAGV
jgi:hypothetical protein